mgnify:FL=1
MSNGVSMEVDCEKKEKTAKKTKRAKKAGSETPTKGNGYTKEFHVDKALGDFVGSDMCSRTTVRGERRCDD